jgi:hypothetical protein
MFRKFPMHADAFALSIALRTPVVTKSPSTTMIVTTTITSTNVKPPENLARKSGLLLRMPAYTAGYLLL